MNEKIKELAKQAGCKVVDDGEWYIPSAAGVEKVVYTSGVGLEKFAQLIIEEANDVIYNLLEENTGAEVVVRVKEHFGVE